MKIQYTLLTLVCLSLSTVTFAHCPTAFKEERVCLMLDKDKLFIYDQKFEHNGPYKDLEKAQISAFKTAAGADLSFKKVARGIFKIEGGEKEKNITVVVDADKKKSELKVSQQH